MRLIEQIGLANALSRDDKIVHTSISGRSAFGRISDLLCEWSLREFSFEIAIISGIRVLVQALLEFSIQEQSESIPQLEMAYSQGTLFLATRLVCAFPVDASLVEKTLTQYWVNAEEAKLLKKILGPEDHIEVRFQEKTKLIEWRVCRPITEEAKLNAGTSFLVFLDAGNDVGSENLSYTDLGDLPFETWMQEAYKSASKASASGEISIAGGENLEQNDLVKFVADKEIEEAFSYALKSDLDGASPSENSEFTSDRSESPLSIRLKDFAEGNHPESQEATQLIEDLRLKEKAWLREQDSNRLKLKALEDLIVRKERENQIVKRRHQEMSSQVEALRARASVLNENNPFRDKALKLYEMLTKAKQDNAALEKIVFELRNKKNDDSLSDFSQSIASDRGGVQTSGEDVNKKLDRTLRVLDSEKAKVASLSERVMAAEKAAEKSGPQIKDLESKVETTLKASLQHKKDVELVKQKLVQSEAEKNKIQNELIKAQAQISTLMKRQAA
jgi:hypothetical protein